MERDPDLHVYVLGAGCSARYGYPLASTFREALKEHADALRQMRGCERLSQISSETVDLMERHGTPTIDRLTRFLFDAAHGQPWRSIVVDAPENREFRDREQLTRTQIRNAKLATTSLFLSREGAALGQDLSGYNDLLSELFEGDRRLTCLSSTKNRVLSFNQDRLFEIAFCRRFLRPNQYRNGYGCQLLNSGLACDVYETHQPVESGRFCFLKLHGSAGGWVDRFAPWPRYFSLSANDFNDEFCWPTNPDRSTLRGEPLIVFPFEKEGVFDLGHTPAYAEYLKMVWDHAANLFAQASRIQFIGYSFDWHDRGFLHNRLLRQVGPKCEIIVQGIEPDLSRITGELNRLDPSLRNRFEAIERLF
ncbi:MAG: hypothetical protein AB9869_25530 [Verrucomicrobiia bacterium]